MSVKLLQQRLGRRRFLRTSAAGLAMAGTAGAFPRFASAADTVKIGFLAPLTGDVAAWGAPGLYGCQIWAEWVNAAGGVNIAGKPHMVEFVAFDDE